MLRETVAEKEDRCDLHGQEREASRYDCPSLDLALNPLPTFSHPSGELLKAAQHTHSWFYSVHPPYSPSPTQRSLP